jgi:hypothetical protein
MHSMGSKKANKTGETKVIQQTLLKMCEIWKIDTLEYDKHIKRQITSNTEKFLFVK